MFSDRDAIEAGGLDADCTPVDKLMRNGPSFAAAWAMEHDSAHEQPDT